jgi:hypothetical protein
MSHTITCQLEKKYNAQHLYKNNNNLFTPQTWPCRAWQEKKTIRPDAPIWMQSILDVSEKYYDFIKYFGF